VGRRGLGSPFAPANWGINASEYVTSANENILVMVQIETKEGVDNVKAIAETAGIGLNSDASHHMFDACSLSSLVQTYYLLDHMIYQSPSDIHPHLPIPVLRSSQ
jgi:HpcH/HpaI aldolase/citrate lyase family